MKKIALLFIVVLFTGIVFAQTHPSGKIKKTFKKQYPEAEDVSWTSKGEYKLREWRAMYHLDDVLHTTWYDYKGNWIQTKTKIDQSELPKAVLKSVEEDYYGFKIVISARFTNPDIDGFEVFLDSEREGYAVQFTKDGKTYLRTYSSEGYRPIDDDGHQIEE